MASSVPTPARSALRPLAAAPRTGALRGPWLAARIAAALSLTTGWVHLAYMESHFAQWWGYGMFFLVAGAGQALFTIAILRFPRPAVILAGIVVNLAVVLTYVISRTVGVPVGPHADVAEQAGVIDLATTAGELLTIGALLVMADRRTRAVVVNLMMITGGILWYLRLTNQLF